MGFTTHVAQADAFGPAGSLDVHIEVRNCDDYPEGAAELCWITTWPEWDKPSGSELVIPPAFVDVFHRALGLAIAEGRRTGVLPPPMTYEERDAKVAELDAQRGTTTRSQGRKRGRVSAA